MGSLQQKLFEMYPRFARQFVPTLCKKRTFCEQPLLFKSHTNCIVIKIVEDSSSCPRIHSSFGKKREIFKSLCTPDCIQISYTDRESMSTRPCYESSAGDGVRAPHTFHVYTYGSRKHRSQGSTNNTLKHAVSLINNAGNSVRSLLNLIGI